MSAQTTWRSRLSTLIEAEIQACGMTQEQFAKISDVDEATISRLIRGQQERVHGKTLEKLAEAMKLPQEFLSKAMRLSAFGDTHEEKITEPLPGIRMLISEERIRAKVEELARRIETYYQDRPFIIIGVLTGAWIFTADLTRALQNSNFEVDFIRTSKYRDGSNPNLLAEVRHNIVADIAGKEVLIVEDISDTGETLEMLIDHLWTKRKPEQRPKDIKVCALLDKPDHPKKPTVDFVGFRIENVWVVGYGLDDNGSRRNLPYIGYVPSKSQ